MQRQKIFFTSGREGLHIVSIVVGPDDAGTGSGAWGEKTERNYEWQWEARVGSGWNN